MNEEFQLGLVKRGTLGTIGYVITRDAMKKLLERFPRMTAEIDRIMHAYWMTGLRTFVLNPAVAFHGESSARHKSFIETGGGYRTGSRSKVKYFLEFSVPKRVSFYRHVNGFRYS